MFGLCEKRLFVNINVYLLSPYERLNEFWGFSVSLILSVRHGSNEFDFTE